MDELEFDEISLIDKFVINDIFSKYLVDKNNNRRTIGEQQKNGWASSKNFHENMDLFGTHHIFVYICKPYGGDCLSAPSTKKVIDP